MLVFIAVQRRIVFHNIFCLFSTALFSYLGFVWLGSLYLGFFYFSFSLVHAFLSLVSCLVQYSSVFCVLFFELLVSESFAYGVEKQDRTIIT